MSGKEYEPRQVEILKVVDETPDTKTFRLKTRINLLPGQFVEASVLGIGEAPISNCSYNGEFLELMIRDVGNVTHAIHQLKAGDKLWIRGPYGHGYPMEEMKHKNILVVAGGTGAAPPRSVLQYVEHHRRDYGDVRAIIGFRSPKDLIFKYDFERFSRLFDFTVTVDKGDDTWNGKVGLVTQILEEKKVPAQNTAVVTCGPPIMIKFVIQSLKKLGFYDSQIYVSYERHMRCGLGHCGHCIFSDKYICKDGPVFRYDQVKELHD